MIDLTVYDKNGAATGESYSFANDDISPPVNQALLHSALVMYGANQRQGTVKSKSRAEVSGSSRKLYKQKGTGNARAGNKRTPVRRGGGHCFAKSPKEWRITMPRKARQLATKMALLGKLESGRVYFIESLEMESPKTRVITKLISTLGLTGKSGLIAIGEHNETVWKSCRNIERVDLSTAANLNARAILQASFLIVTRSAMQSMRRQAAT
jgi:large subunit ribosomal protein L4